jgi:hypothetical protein
MGNTSGLACQFLRSIFWQQYKLNKTYYSCFFFFSTFNSSKTGVVLCSICILWFMEWKWIIQRYESALEVWLLNRRHFCYIYESITNNVVKKSMDLSEILAEKVLKSLDYFRCQKALRMGGWEAHSVTLYRVPLIKIRNNLISKQIEQ